MGMDPVVIIPRALVLVATLLGLCIALDMPAGFVDAADVVPSLVVEMRYFTMHNFVGSPVMGYDGAHVCTNTLPSSSLLHYCLFNNNGPKSSHLLRPLTELTYFLFKIMI